MLRKNFIKGKFLTSQVEEEKSTFINRLLYLIPVLLLIFIVSNFITSLNTKKYIKSLNTDIKQLEIQADMLLETRKDNEKLSEKLRVMRSHYINDLNCLLLIKSISDQDNKDLWIEEMQLIQGETDEHRIYQINLQGYANDLNILTKFLKNIQEKQVFNKVELIDSYQEKVDKDTMIKFSVKLKKIFIRK